jgi:hypothetical protein
VSGRLIMFVGAVALALAACGGDDDSYHRSPPPRPAVTLDPMDARSWSIGPHAEGVASQPQAHADGWAILLPRNAGSANYVTMPTGPLTGKTGIHIRFRIDAEPGVKIVPTSNPKMPSALTLYFQRCHDDWSAQGKFETYRWYASFATQSPLETNQEYEIAAPFTANWTAIETSSKLTRPAEFDAALADACRVGFVLGGGTGLGHGIYATGQATLVVTAFQVV